MYRILTTGLLFLLPAAALPDTEFPFNTNLGLDYVTGRAVFEKTWVGAPASTGASDGLGPRYNARSCDQCHPGGGRGSLDDLVFRVNDPVYGRQIQDKAVAGLPGEGDPLPTYSKRRLTLADGKVLELRVPHYDLTALENGPLRAPGFSVRLPPPLDGLGRLAAIPDAKIEARADPLDEDGDGISGRVGRVNGALGRFGWKAEAPDLEMQVAAALSLDLGIGSALLPDAYGDCTDAQKQCRAMGNGNSDHYGGLEAGHELMASLLYFLRRLPPSPSPDVTEAAARGEALFEDIGCGACHRGAYSLEDGEIRPYTDLLLHDMGPALADDDSAAAVYKSNAGPEEWRTPPLWGLSRAGEDTVYLHDGRALTLLEAILWHGGEAAGAQARFAAMDAAGRADLLAFLQSL